MIDKLIFGKIHYPTKNIYLHSYKNIFIPLFVQAKYYLFATNIIFSPVI